MATATEKILGRPQKRAVSLANFEYQLTSCMVFPLWRTNSARDGSRLGSCFSGVIFPSQNSLFLT
jgi:hypothetical protein